jgi:hypothetical protein
MRRRRPSKLTFTPEERFSEEARRLREEAKLLPPGALRDELIRKARHAEAASHMNGCDIARAASARVEVRPPQRAGSFIPKLSRTFRLNAVAV